MELVLNINPQEYKKYDNQNQYYDFNFLNSEFQDFYYKMISSLDEKKLINLYRFLYLRLIKINKKYNTGLLPVFKKINFKEFNDNIKNFIGNNFINEIIILNGIQLYFI